MILVIGNPNGVFYHRLQVPYEDMLMRGYMVKFGTIEDLGKLKEHVSYLVVNRGIASKDHRQFRAMLNAYNIKLILDIDDWWNLPHNHSSKSQVKGTHIINTIKIADQLHTTNGYLAEKLQKINPYVPIWILPNAIDPRREQWMGEKTKSDTLRVGYLGALHHDYDLQWNGIDLSGHESWSIEYYQQAIHTKHAFERKDYTTYGELYRGIDVAIAPLAPTEFNRCKSNLKALEAGFTKTCLIAQDMHPYTPFLNSTNSILCKTAYDWKEALETITPEVARGLAEQLYEDVQFFHIDNINNTREKCFEE
jgi:hypothetical protein